MNVIARYNLKKGIPENKFNDSTNYTPENEIDRWIIAHEQKRNRINQLKTKEQQHKALQGHVEKVIKEKLEECLDNTLHNAVKGIK